jgi:hypothetical protein
MVSRHHILLVRSLHPHTSVVPGEGLAMLSRNALDQASIRDMPHQDGPLNKRIWGEQQD